MALALNILHLYAFGNIQERQIRRGWRVIIEAQFWRQGRLNMREYLLLKLDPHTVRVLERIYGQSPPTGDVDVLLKFLDTRFQNFKTNRWSVESLRCCLKYGSIEELPPLSTLTRDEASNLHYALLRWGERMITPVLLKEFYTLFPPNEGEMMEAFSFKNRLMADLLTSSAYDLEAPDLDTVVQSGWVDYLDRFSLREDFLQGKFSLFLLGHSSLEMAQLWLDHQYEASIEEMKKVAGGAIAAKNMPLLRLIREEFQWGYKSIAEVVNERSNPEYYNLDEIISTGHEELLELVVGCLFRDRFYPESQ